MMVDWDASFSGVFIFIANMVASSSTHWGWNLNFCGNLNNRETKECVNMLGIIQGSLYEIREDCRVLILEKLGIF